MTKLFILLSILSFSGYTFANMTCNETSTKKQIEINKPVPGDESTDDDSDIQ